jgi:hypothetical protein
MTAHNGGRRPPCPGSRQPAQPDNPNVAQAANSGPCAHTTEAAFRTAEHLRRHGLWGGWMANALYLSPCARCRKAPS